MSCALATVSLCGSVETVQWPGDSDDVSDICLITEPWSHIMSATDIMSNYVTLFTLHCCCLSSDQCDYENIIQVATFPVYQVMTMTVTVTDHHHLDRKLDSVSKHYLEFISTLDNLRVHFSVTLICGVIIYISRYNTTWKLTLYEKCFMCQIETCLSL